MFSYNLAQIPCSYMWNLSKKLYLHSIVPYGELYILIITLLILGCHNSTFMGVNLTPCDGAK